MAVLDWSQCPAVESVPGKVSGAWVLKGTRMPVSAIFENLEAGANLDDIMEWYDGLDREQVKASLSLPPAVSTKHLPSPCRFARCASYSIKRRLYRFAPTSRTRGPHSGAARMDRLKNGELLVAAETDGFDVC